jgi:exosortase
MVGPERIWLALLAVVFAPAALELARVWRTVDYYGHGFFIPVFSAASYLATRRRLGPPTRDRRGAAVVGGALALYLLGIASGSVTLQGLALVAAIAGVVVARWSFSGLRALAFPVGFLLFMVPLPPPLVSPLIIALQVVVSVASVEVLSWLGMAVAREGNVLVLPSGEPLFVAEACSGITSIVTLLPLGVLLAHFTERSWARRLLLVAAVVPIAMLGNLLRVVLTALAAERFGVEAATQSTLHELGGLATFSLACLALVALGVLLRSRGRGMPSPRAS